MFIIFKDKEDNTRAVNYSYIENIGPDDSGDYFIETHDHYWEITEDQYMNIINNLNNMSNYKPSCDCRIFVNSL